MREGLEKKWAPCARALYSVYFNWPCAGTPNYMIISAVVGITRGSRNYFPLARARYAARIIITHRKSSKFAKMELRINVPARDSCCARERAILPRRIFCNAPERALAHAPSEEEVMNYRVVMRGDCWGLNAAVSRFVFSRFAINYY